MTITPLPHLPRPRESAILHAFLLAGLEPRAGAPKAIMLSGRQGAGKRSLLRHVFESDPRFRAFKLADEITREILTGDTQPGAWKSPVADAAGSMLGAAHPALGLAVGVVSPFIKEHLSNGAEPDAVRDPFLEPNGKPLLLVVPAIDPADGSALAFHAHRIHEAHDRALPHALVILDDSPADPAGGDGADPGITRTLAGLRRCLGDDRRLEVLPMGAFSQAECQAAFAGLGLPADWAGTMYQLSDGGAAELCALWRSLQLAGVIVPASDGRWQAKQSGAATGWTLVRDALDALLQHRMPADPVHQNRLLNAFQLAASMGSTFLPQAVAECVAECDPKRGELDRESWEDAWYHVLEYEDAEHPALAVTCDDGGQPRVLQGDGRQCFVYTFRDPALSNLLRAATRQMWRDWEAHAGENRPHQLLVAGSHALDAWIERTFRERWREALPFRAALLRARNRDWNAGALEDLDHRLRLVETLRARAEVERRRVAAGKEAGELYACLLWYADTLSDLARYPEETATLREAKTLADTGRVHLSALQRVHLQSNLGDSLDRQGAYPAAEAMLSETFRLSTRLLGYGHPSTLGVAHTLGNVQESQGRYAQAAALYVHAVEGRERVVGREAPATLASVHSLADNYYKQGRFDLAEPLFVRALKGRERVLRADHPDILTTMTGLADLYESQGRYAEAEPLYLRVVHGYERTMGPEHPNLMTTIHNLGVLYRSQERLAEGEPLLERALNGFERAMGVEHPSTLTAAHSLGSLYARLEAYEQAERLLVRALTGYEQALEPGHPFTLIAASTLADLYGRQGRFAEAEPLSRNALEAHARVLGPEHPNSLRLAYNLAKLCERQGCLDEAEALYQKTLAGRERALGPMHPKTVRVRDDLQALLRGRERRAGERVDPAPAE